MLGFVLSSSYQGSLLMECFPQLGSLVLAWTDVQHAAP